MNALEGLYMISPGTVREPAGMRVKLMLNTVPAFPGVRTGMNKPADYGMS